jgi:hypothetical protein
MFLPRCQFSRIVAAGLLVTSAEMAIPACTTFGPVNPKQFIISSRPQQVWLWKADSSVVLVRGPHFLPGSDTLVGVVDGAYQEIPLSEIRQVKASWSAPARTAALVVGGAGAIVITALLLKKSPTPNDSVCAHTPPCFCDVSCLYP